MPSYMRIHAPENRRTSRKESRIIGILFLQKGGIGRGPTGSVPCIERQATSQVSQAGSLIGRTHNRTENMRGWSIDTADKCKIHSKAGVFHTKKGLLIVIVMFSPDTVKHFS